MMKRIRIFVIVCVLGAALCLTAGCGSQDGSNNNSVTEGTDQKENKDEKNDGIVGDGVEDLGDGAGDAIKDVGDGVGDAVEDAGKGVGDAVEDVGDGVKDATENAENKTDTQGQNGTDRTPENGEDSR